jgi:RimJ/RimL family protein N-acetyltransferase
MDNHIVLRPWAKPDAAQLAYIANNRKVWLNVRDRFPFPYTVGDAIEWIVFTSNQKPVQNMAIVYKNKIAGSIGVMVKDDVYRKSIEIGYFLGEEFWGEGVATAAVNMLLQYIQQQFDVVRIYAEVFEHNKASMRVLEKNGFHREVVRIKSVYKNNVLMNDHVWVKFIDV